MMGSILYIISLLIFISIANGAQYDSHNEKCNLYPERGNCHQAFQMKWYYHPFSGKCKKFFYSGCDGNENRFDTEEDCLSQCTYGRVGEDIKNYQRCHEPYDKGDCWGDFERWYFDSNKGECICTSYSGCGGSANKFYSFNHCMEICGDFSKSHYQKNYYERSEHGQRHRQRIGDISQQSGGRQPVSQPYAEELQKQQLDSQIDPRYGQYLRGQQAGSQTDPRYGIHPSDPRYEEYIRRQQAESRYDEQSASQHQTDSGYQIQPSDPRYEEYIRRQQAESRYDEQSVSQHQTDPRYQIQPSDPRYEEYIRRQQAESRYDEQSASQHQTDPRYQIHPSDPRYEEYMRSQHGELVRPSSQSKLKDPRYLQQQKEYEERLREYNRQKEEFLMRQAQEQRGTQQQVVPRNLANDMDRDNVLTVDDVMPHDPHPWHQVEPEFPTRRRWVRKFHKRSHNNDLEKEADVKKRNTRSTYRQETKNLINHKESSYSSYYDSRDYGRKYWANDGYPIRNGKETFVAYAPFRRYNRFITTVERNAELPIGFEDKILRDQPLRSETDFEPINTEDITNFKLPSHLTHLPLSEKKKYWKKIVNRRYEEAKKLRNQRMKAISMYAKFLENDLKKKMRSKIKVHYVPEYKYYLVRREEYPEENNLETTALTFEKYNKDQSFNKKYITTTEKPIMNVIDNNIITTLPPAITIPTPPTTSRIYTRPSTTTTTTTTTSKPTTTTTPKPTELVWDYNSRRPLDIESTKNEYTSTVMVQSKKPKVEFSPIRQIIDLDDYQPFDNTSQEDNDFEDMIITKSPETKEIPTTIITTTTEETPSINDDPIQIVFPTKKTISNDWTFDDDDDDDDVFFFKPQYKKLMDHNNHHNHDMIGTTTIPTSINDMDHSNHHNMDHSNHHNMDHSNHHNMDHQHHHSMDHSNHHSMKMWFHGGTNEVILFDFWTINSLNGLLFSCLLIFISAACYEGLKWFRVYLQTESSKGTLFHIFNRKSSSNADKEMHRIGDGDKAVPLNKHCCSNDECPSNQQVHVSDCKSRISKESPCMRLLLSFLYVLQLTLAYCLMLITMTYNIYLGAAVVLGAGLGNYLFSGIECSKDKNQIQKYAEDACH